MGYNLRTSAQSLLKGLLNGLFKGLLLALPLASLQPALGAQTQGAPKQNPVLKDKDHFVIQFAVEDENRISLGEFVKTCQVATGINFLVTDATQTALEQKKVTMYGSKRIHKDDFYAFFQIQMFINDFVCVEVGPPHIAMVLIRSLAPTGGRQNTSIRQTATAVEPADLQDYADQPATLITTVLNLPNLDSRTLSQALRGMMVDTATQSLIPAGDHSIILTGFGSYVASIARLLQIINDESAPEAPVVPIFDVIPLTHSVADDVAEIIEQLLEDRRRAAQQSVRGGRQTGADGQRTGAGGQGNNSDFTSVLVHSRTNSLLVTALPEDMPNIKELIARLDVDVIEPERNFHIYSLENVRAEDIADVLDDFLRDADRANRNSPANASAGRTGGGGGGGGAGTRNEEVVVVPDSNSNSLLISANKQRYEEVIELIRQLDERQPQVLIETALIELNSSDSSSLGIEWALADIVGNGGFGTTSFGLSTFNSPIDPSGIPDVRVPNISSGLTAGILDGDSVNLPFLIAAANSSANANVLNIPSVLVRNNGRATVTSTDEQPTTTVTQGTAGGNNQENFDEYVEAGISLEISPSISGARYLRLDISLRVSNFTSSFASSTIPPPRVTREMVTTVNVPDGDTMVIGGVIADIERHARESVPFLGDLPLIGQLFRSDTTSSNRTTLYFFVTPHILRDRDFADLWEISYQKKLEAAEVIGPERVRQVDKYFDINDESVDFSRFEVPLYKSPERGDVKGEGFALDALRRSELQKQAAQNGQGN